MSKWPVGITASPGLQLVSTAQSADLALRQAAALAQLGKKALAVRPLHLPARASLSKSAVAIKRQTGKTRKG